MKNNKVLKSAVLVSAVLLTGCNKNTDTIETFKASFYNYDQTKLYEVDVNKGEIPVYQGETPTKPNEGDVEYLFSGWDPVLAPIEEDTSYTALYNKVVTSLNVMDESIIHYTGRVHLDNDEATFNNANSAFEFKFYGSEVSATLNSSNPRLKFRVYVDNDEEGTIINLPSSGSVTLANSLSTDWHTIKVAKANTEAFGFATLSAIEGASKYSSVNYQNRPKFEFYGDSLISGYGVNCLEGDTPENEDCSVAYANLIAKHYKADITSLAYSGVSIALPHWITWLASDRFEQYSYVQDSEKWDFNKYTPDIVFICLGANDSGVININNKSTFVAKVLDMIIKLKGYYPDSKIVCYYGVTSTTNFIDQAYQEVVSNFEPEDQVYYLNATKSTCSGFNGHLNKAEQQGVANELIKYLDDNNFVK